VAQKIAVPPAVAARGRCDEDVGARGTTGGRRSHGRSGPVGVGQAAAIAGARRDGGAQYVATSGHIPSAAISSIAGHGQVSPVSHISRERRALRVSTTFQQEEADRHGGGGDGNCGDRLVHNDVAADEDLGRDGRPDVHDIAAADVANECAQQGLGAQLEVAVVGAQRVGGAPQNAEVGVVRLLAVKRLVGGGRAVGRRRAVAEKEQCHQKLVPESLSEPVLQHDRAQPLHNRVVQPLGLPVHLRVEQCGRFGLDALLDEGGPHRGAVDQIPGAIAPDNLDLLSGLQLEVSNTVPQGCAAGRRGLDRGGKAHLGALVEGGKEVPCPAF